MRVNLDNSRLHKPRMYSPRMGHVELTLTGSYSIDDTVDAPNVFFFNGGASVRSIFLPAVSPDAGQMVIIANTGNTSNLSILDHNGVGIVTVVPHTMGVFLSSSSGTWSTITSSGPAPSWTSQDVTAPTGTIAATDSEVRVNRNGVVVLTLPNVEAWYMQHQDLQSSLLISDVGGHATASNITINPTGPDTINSLASIAITADYGAFRLRRLATGLWSIV
jgi:hypothetical protein